MRDSRAVFLIVCLLCVCTVAACGDDDSGGGDSVEDFIAKADGFCADAARESLRNPQPTPTTAQEAVPVLQVSIKRRESLLADFEGLGDPPEEIADKWSRVIESQRTRLEDTRELLRLSRQGVKATDPRYVRIVEAQSDSSDAENELQKAMGSTACAEVLPPDERRRIVDFVTAWETRPFDDCAAVTTDDGIDLLWGTVEKCQQAQQDARENPQELTKSLKVTQVEGIAEVSASVDATVVGGVNDGLKFTYTVVFQDGRYKVDAVTLEAGEA